MRRTSLMIDKNVADEFSVQAERAGKTLYNFANEWLDAASKISDEGGTANNLLGNWKVWFLLRQIDVITLPAGFVEELISKLYAAEKENLFKMFGDLGASLATLMKMVAPDIEQLTVLANGFVGIAPLKRIEIARTDGNSILMSVVGAGRSMETTECSFEFLKALLNGYGYHISSQEIGIGTIRIRATKRGV